MNSFTHPINEDWTVMGESPDHHGVRRGKEQQGPWLASFPVCHALESFDMLHLGTARVKVPYRMERRSQSSHYFLACTAGEGRVYLDDTWIHCGKDMAFFLPAGLPCAFRAHGRSRWTFCWVCYDAEAMPAGMLSAPRVGSFDSRSLFCAVDGLRAMVESPSTGTSVRQWLTSVNSRVLQFIRSGHDDSIADAWTKVSGSLARPWTLDEICDLAGCNKAKLRHWAAKSFGRSPMRQLYHLRLVRSAQMLLSTGLEAGEIAGKLGFQSRSAFMTSFSRWAGQTPEMYRAGSGQPAATATASGLRA